MHQCIFFFKHRNVKIKVCMKKYVVSLLFLIAQNMCAMELEQLSSQDDTKALRFAKLFNKYPHGYGEDKNQIDACKKTINYFFGKFDFLQSQVEPLYCKCPSGRSTNQEDIDAQIKTERFWRQFKSLSARVKQYQAMLHNMEADEILDYMHEKLPCDRKSQIFAAALYDGAHEYYAMSNALKFVILESHLVMFSGGYYTGVVGWYRPCFLAELYEDDRPTICFSDDAFTCTLHCLKPSIVKACSRPGYTGKDLRLRRCDQKAFKQEAVDFVTQDARDARLNSFKTLFAGWVEYLSNETNKEKYMNAFVELLKRLNWHDISLFSAKDCEKVLQREDTLQNIGNW
jgi:hypothetical protein